MRLRKAIVGLIVGLALVQVVYAQDHWVTTWVAAPQQPRGPAGPPGAAPAPTAFNDQTIRMVARTSLGGRRARVTLSNAFATAPLKIGTAHIALRSKESAIVPGSDRTLMFSGKPSVTIPPGAQMISDTIDLDIPQLGDIAISVYVPADSGPLTTHATGLHTTYIAKGNVASEPVLNDTTTTRSYYWLSAIDVMAPSDAAAIVAFGDSITDGATSTNDGDHSW